MQQGFAKHITLQIKFIFLLLKNVSCATGIEYIVGLWIPFFWNPVTNRLNWYTHAQAPSSSNGVAVKLLVKISISGVKGNCDFDADDKFLLTFSFSFWF